MAVGDSLGPHMAISSAVRYAPPTGQAKLLVQADIKVAAGVGVGEA